MMSQDVEPSIDWEPYKTEILSHFVDQNHTLGETMAHMKSMHGLNATARQFKRRFGGYKNLRAHEWIAVVEEVRNRAMRGIDSEVCLHGRPIDRERVKREVRRRGNDAQTEESKRVVISLSTRERICIRTPARRSPSPSAFSSANVQLVTTSTSLDSIFLDLDFGGDVNMGMEDDFGDCTTLSATGTPSFPAFTRISEGVGNDLVEDIVLHSSTSMVVSPSAVPFDLNGFNVDENFDWVLAINLPWFQLQQKLELQELGSRTNSPWISTPRLGGVSGFSNSDSRSQTGTVLDFAVTERHRLLGSLLGYSATGSVSDLVPSFTTYFSTVLPERFEGEMEMRVQQFFDPSYKYPLQRLFELVAFFVSNNKPTKEKIKDFLKWVIDQKHTPQLESFLRLDTSTTRTFSQRILEAAASMQNTDLLRSLLRAGADFRPVICEAIQTKDSGFVELLLSRVDPECLSGDSGGHLLLYICETENVRAASILVDNGANVNFNSYSHQRWGRTGTPLYRAVSRKQPKMVKFLLDKGANVNVHCSGSDTSTALAASVGMWNHNIEIVTVLLEHGADIHCSVYGEDLLEYVSLNCKDVHRLIREKRGTTKTLVTVGDILDASKNGSGPLSEYLSRHGDNVSQNQLEKALYESINKPDCGTRATLALLDWGVNPDGPTLDEPPLLLAAICAEEKAIPAAQLLIAAGADVNIPDLLCRAIEEGSFEFVCELLDAGIDLDQFGPEALEKAVLEENVETVALLIDKGIPINVVGCRRSPLQAAALKTLALAEYLLDRGADVNTPAFGYEGRTALQSACESGNLDMVNFLLANKADVNAPAAPSKGITAIEAVLSCSATDAVKEELFKLLLENGAKVTLSNKRLGNGIIHTIVKKGLTKLLEIALKAGADANSMSRGNEGRTPLQLASELGQLDVVKALVEHGVKINAPPAYQHGRTALQAAAAIPSPNIELLNYLVDNGAEVNAAAGICGGITAMQGAAIAGNIPVVKFLWGKGALVNGKPALKDGRTAIEGAAEHGRLDTVQLLLNYGAIGDVGVEKGLKKAIKLAEDNRHTEIVDMLRSAQSALESAIVGR